jgi:hypothetical protein
LPYIFVQTLIYGVLVYSMIGFEWTVAKFLWYLFFMYFTLLYFTFYGMMAVGLTPNESIAAIISSAFYNVWNLFSGFLIPRPVSYSPIGFALFLIFHSLLLVVLNTWPISYYSMHSFFFQRIPVWWRWYSWICPVAWTLYGLVASQFGDITHALEDSDKGQTVAQFITEYYGFHHDLLWLVALVHVALACFFAFLFSFAIMKFNFQKR